MPQTAIFIYKESDGKVPLIEWFDTIPNKAQDKCIARIEILQEKGHELRRPICDYLDKGIYELRSRYENVHYRVLYAFVGRNIVLLSHGCTKVKEVPKREIRRAISNLRNYVKDPKAHTYLGEL